MGLFHISRTQADLWVINKFLILSLLLFLSTKTNGNVMMNYEANSHPNHIPITAKYSGGSVRMRDNSYSRNYNYPSSGDDSSPNMNSVWGGGGGRPMSSLASTNLQAAASHDFGFGASAASENYPSSSGGHGHGHGHNSHAHGKGDCNTALGLLGVLGLASYLQNVLRQMTTTAAAPAPAPPGRRKRDVKSLDESLTLKKISKGETEYDVTDKIMPLLTAVGHARDGLIPLPCTQRPVCLVNKLLVEEFDSTGKAIGAQLSTAITKILKEVDKYGIVDRMISKASQTGAKGEDCIQIYPSCPVLDRLPSYSVPSSMQLYSMR